MASKTKLSTVAFTLAAIAALKNGEDKDGVPYKGIHAKYSGFNSAFKDYFGKDPIQATTAMHKNGDIVVVPCRGGVTLYKPGDVPARTDNSGKAALAKMGI